jgi:DNA segregation ATPase FtsK/SpoIIIE, S-DNA-T family
MLNREVAYLAKRKKKRASFGANLKYEIYGILLITISVIAISGEAAVGRSLSKLFAFLLGTHYYFLALAGVWAGLYVMIRRSWPRGWTSKRSGFVLVTLLITLWSSMADIDKSLGAMDGITAGGIVSQTSAQLKEQLWQVPPEQDVPVMQKNVGGGMVGALQYSILYWMFGYYGAKFVLIIELAIALMLITNRSYVEMAQSIRLFLLRVSPLIAARFSSGRKLLSAKAIPVKGVRKPAVQTPMDSMPDDDGLDDAPLAPKQRKAPLFFQLFHGKSDREMQLPPDDNWEEEDPVYQPGTRQHTPADHSGGEHAAGVSARNQDAEPAAPRFTDFTAQTYSEPPWNAEEHEEPIAKEPAAVHNEPDKPEQSITEGEALSHTPPAAVKPSRKPQKPYRLPNLNLLDKPASSGKSGNPNDYMNTARKLEATLESFGVRAKVLDVARGPAVTRYELHPDVGVKVSRIVSLTDDIALALAAKDIRMEAPIPGKSAIGIEVPNNEVSVVTLREVLETQPFKESPAKLTIAFGRDISGQPIVGNLARMPHMLVAGATGSGKSVCINGIITSLLYKAKPDEVKFLMIDPKMVELNVYNGIPHLLAPVVTDPRRASLALKKIVVEMEKRYESFSKSGTRNIEAYNALMLSGDNPDGVLPYIVVIVDELADLMMVAAGDVEDSITRLAQMARAAGIHLIIATQRPSVDVITGVIKANIPSRIAFGVSSQVDSRTILDMVGAEKLLGRGDMLFLPMGASKPIRVQGAFLSDSEVEAVVAYARGQAEAEYNEELVPELDETESNSADEFIDELFDQAVQIVLDAKQASVSLLQRRMRIGYTRAARLIDSMEAKGIVGPYEGSKPREVLMTIEQYQQRIPS